MGSASGTSLLLWSLTYKLIDVGNSESYPTICRKLKGKFQIRKGPLGLTQCWPDHQGLGMAGSVKTGSLAPKRYDLVEFTHSSLSASGLHKLGHLIPVSEISKEVIPRASKMC